MNRIYRYIYLNLFTLLLDLCVAGIIMSVVVIPYLRCNVICLIIISCTAVFLLKQALVLHGTSGEKNRAYHELNEQNRTAFDPASYAKYMNAPCTRRIVKLSLKHLGRYASYPELKAMYMEHFYIPRKQVRYKITFFENNEPLPPDRN